MASMALSDLLFLLLFLLHSFSISTSLNITLNSTLLANDNTKPWISPSGDFAFGFHKIPIKDLFVLAIWFYNIPDKTIVWYANGDNPAPQGSRLQITADGLLLTDPNNRQIWKNQLSQSGTVSYGAMLDSGNFVLADSNSIHLWESFKDPKDTLLPSQTLDSSTVLFSRLAETNFSRGRFELFFTNDGGLELSPVGWPKESRYGSYFRSGSSGTYYKALDQLVFNGSTSDIYLMKLNGEIAKLPWKRRRQNIAAVTASNYYRATLGYTGVFTMYAYPREARRKQNWSIVQYLPEDICSVISNHLGSGACGYNSYCTVVDGRPNCTCPPGYSFIDENNNFGGCKPNFPLGCGVDDGSVKLEDVYEFQPLENVNWPHGDYEHIIPFSEEECIASCLEDCLCAVAIYGSPGCWKKKIPLSNGRSEGVGFGTKALFKVRKGAALFKVRKGAAVNDLGPTCLTKEKDDYNSVLLGSFSASLIALSSILFLFLNRKSENSNRLLALLEANLHVFSYKEVEEATRNFKEEIGRGSSAIVYKGILKYGSNCAVAVKKLDKLAQETEKEFKQEMKVIGKTCHKNLVRLLGFCEEAAHRILVYQFMPNGTLSNFLFGIPKPAWNLRAKIALEIAKGLVYLHEECEAPIIHCDIKPENILLDGHCTAKISDFGLAKLLHSNQSRTLTNIRGTRGYVAPEWFRNVAITAKVDVYSFGVMLLEIICCRKNVPKLEDEEGILTELVYDCFVEGKIDTAVEFDTEAAGDQERIGRWICIGIWCIQEDPSKRPSMKMVLQMLEGLLDVPSPPMPLYSSTF